jgi:hypothetical protein
MFHPVACPAAGDDFQREIGAVAGLEQELTAAAGPDQRAPNDEVGVTAGRETVDEMFRVAVIVAVDLDARSRSCGSIAPRAQDPNTYTSVTRLTGHSR